MVDAIRRAYDTYAQYSLEVRHSHCYLRILRTREGELQLTYARHEFSRGWNE